MKTIKKLTFEEFLALNKVSLFSNYTLDKCKYPHGRTERQKKRDLKACENALNEHKNKVNKLREKYNRLLENGEIMQPNSIEKALKTAHGHEDNESVQSARRTLAKRGIDWRTGEKL